MDDRRFDRGHGTVPLILLLMRRDRSLLCGALGLSKWQGLGKGEALLRCFGS